MSNTKGSILISNANAVGTALVNKLGGTGYKPSEWGDAVNIMGITSADIPTALANITEGSYTGSERGAIKYSNCNAVGSMLNKKFSTDRGFKPVEWESAISKLTPLAERTVSGAIAHITDGADEVPIKSWEVEIAPTLSGKSAIECTKSGKNLLDTAISETKTHNSVSVICDGNGKYTATGTATGGSANITFMLKTPCEIKSGMYLHLMNSPANASVSLTIQKQDNTSIYSPTLSPANRIVDLSSYVGEIIYSIRLYVVNNASSELTFSPMICYSNTATTYEPYIEPKTYSANLGRTIYGGTADIVNGVGKETHATVDMGTLTWQYDSANTRFFTVGLTGVIKRGTSGWITDLAVDFPYSVASGTANDKTVSEYASTGYVYIKDTDYTDPTTFKAFLSGKYLTYPLATPTDFTFTPITPTPETALGVNNFWADEGDSEVTYRKDPDIPDTPVQVINMNNNENNDN